MIKAQRILDKFMTISLDFASLQEKNEQIELKYKNELYKKDYMIALYEQQIMNYNFNK